jgi:hypothetical protein
MALRGIVPGFSGLVLAFASAGCSASTADPSPNAGVVESAATKKPSAPTTTTASAPTATSNTQKYKDEGSHPASARAGKSTLTVRALMGKDNATNLEATTGSLDSSATAPGKLEKLQLKTSDAAGNVVYTKNYNGLTGGGSLSYVLTDLGHMQPLQVQANISGIDPKRTDIATVKTSVYYRPDLAPQDLVAPSRAYVDAPVSISATVRERMNDTGARASCILLVDGAEVDRAPNIWVDAHGAVSCAFSHRFKDVGGHAIKVSVSEVVPGDYDASNNTISGSITIEPRSAPVSFWADARDRESSSDATDDYFLSSDGPPAVPDVHYHQVRSRWDQSWWVNINGPRAVSFPVARVSAQVTSGGATLESLAVENLPVTYRGGWNGLTYEWGEVQDPITKTWLGAETDRYPDGTEETWGWVTHYAGSVTYHGERICTEHAVAFGWSCELGTYTWNDTSANGGPRVAMGDSVELTISVVDASGLTWSASPTVALTSRERTSDIPYGQDPWNPLRWYSYSAFDRDKTGQISGSNP